MKVNKRKKSKRMRGKSTNGSGSRKNNRDSGNKGGKGLAGTGKRADTKKTFILKKYGHNYFGKQGITSKKNKRDKTKKINLYSIISNIDSYGKKTEKGFEINLKNYKILGKGDVKDILIIKANSASKSAIRKVKEAKGDIIF
jgi:large subunit ribosomal protein L15